MTIWLITGVAFACALQRQRPSKSFGSSSQPVSRQNPGHDSSRSLENDVTDGVELEEGLFWRPARLQRFLGGWPLGLGSIVGIFFKEEEIDYPDFFGGLWQYSSRSIQKWLFRDFIELFWPAPKFWTFFSDKSSLLGNRLVPFERSTQFLPIPMIFGLLKNPYQSQ